MTKIRVVKLPKSKIGNDPNDYRNDPEFHKQIEATKPESALEILKGLSATNRLDEMEANLGNKDYVIQDLALSGQITLFYGSPNTGKTLFLIKFIIEAIKDQRIKAEKVFYINADDSYDGLNTKSTYQAIPSPRLDILT